MGVAAREVVFHHVLDSEASPAGQLGALEQAVANVRTFVEENLDGQPVPDEAQLKFSVSRGKPAQEILDAAITHRTDTIVMGTNGRAGLDRLLLGSVAETVVRRAPCTVVVVKPGPS